MTYVAAVQAMDIGAIDRNSTQPLGDVLVAPYWLTSKQGVRRDPAE